MTLPGKYIEEDEPPLAQATVVMPISVTPVDLTPSAPVAPTQTTPTKIRPANGHIRPLSDIGREQVRVKCRNCGHEGPTKMHDEWTNESWCWCLGCFFFGLWPCAFLPFCTKGVSFNGTHSFFHI